MNIETIERQSPTKNSKEIFLITNSSVVSERFEPHDRLEKGDCEPISCSMLIICLTIISTIVVPIIVVLINNKIIK